MTVIDTKVTSGAVVETVTPINCPGCAVAKPKTDNPDAPHTIVAPVEFVHEIVAPVSFVQVNAAPTTVCDDVVDPRLLSTEIDNGASDISL